MKLPDNTIVTPSEISTQTGVKLQTLYHWLTAWEKAGMLKPIEQPGQQYQKRPKLAYRWGDVRALLEAQANARNKGTAA